MEKNNLLYVLILKDRQAFKVGITDNDDLVRIKMLSRIYQFDLNESYVIKSSNKSTIKSLERQILADYRHFKYDTGDKRDGSSEFIEFSQLSNVLTEIEFKSRLSHLGITVTKGVVFEKLEISYTPKIIEERKKKKKRKFSYLNVNELDRFKYMVLKNKTKFKFYREIQDNYVVGFLISYDFELIRLITTSIRSGIDYKSYNSSGSYSIYYSACFNKIKNIGYIQLHPVARNYRPVDSDFNNTKKVDLKINGRFADMYSFFRRELKSESKEVFENIDYDL